MALETGTYTSDLVATNPVSATDTGASMGSHLRWIKSAILATFPNLTGAMTATHGQLNTIGRFWLATQTASSSATLDFSSLITSTYDEYVFELINVIPATSGAKLWMRTSADGGSTFAASSGDYFYKGKCNFVGDGGTPNDIDSAGTATKIVLTDANGVSSTASLGGVSGTVRLFAPAGTASNKQMTAVLVTPLGTAGQVTLSGCRAATAAVNGVRFLFDSGNIASGVIHMYGVRK